MGGLGPGIGGSEWFIIGLVALVVVGPERLPGLLRQLGKWVAKARGMANEFRSSFDEMARQSELDELRKEVEALRTGQPIRLGAEAEAAFKDIRSEFDSLGRPQTPAAISAEPAMIHAASEWPDGEPVMLPIAEPPLVSLAEGNAPVVKPATHKRAGSAAGPAKVPGAARAKGVKPVQVPGKPGTKTPSLKADADTSSRDAPVKPSRARRSTAKTGQ